MRSTLPCERGVSLKSLLPDANFFCGELDSIQSCCSDSRHCKEGDLFIALLGDQADGHDFAAEAVANGAAGVLCERPLPVGVPNCLVEDSREAHGRICHALSGNPSESMRCVGVTGSYGKTTTGLLLASILEQSGASMGMLTSMGASDGIDVDTTRRSISSAPSLARWLAALNENGASNAVLEISSSDLANRTLSGVQLDSAVLTNIRRRHLDKHGSLLNYRRINQRLFDHLKPEGFAVINADDPSSKFALSQLTHPTITFGIQAEAEVTASLIEMNHGEQTFMLRAGSELVPVRTRMIGQHHIYNCLAAAATGLVMGLELAQIAQGLERVSHLPGRLEQLAEGQPFAAYVDMACTADSLAATLKSLRRATPNRLICVFGAEGEVNRDERPLLGRTAERLADLGVITSNSPRDEDPQQIAHDVLDGYDRPAVAHWIPDRARAIGWALHQAKEGDTVLIAGKGAAVDEIAGQQRVHFDDREVVKFFLRELVKARESRQRAA